MAEVGVVAGGEGGPPPEDTGRTSSSRRSWSSARGRFRGLPFRSFQHLLGRAGDFLRWRLRAAVRSSRRPEVTKTSQDHWLRGDESRDEWSNAELSRKFERNADLRQLQGHTWWMVHCHTMHLVLTLGAHVHC